MFITSGSSTLQRGKLERFDLGRLFDHVLISEEVGFGKPEQRIFALGLELVHATPKDAWMVGDNLFLDIAPAQAHGIFAIWVDASGKGVPSKIQVTAEGKVKPDMTVLTFAELAGGLDLPRRRLD